ncbi:MAG TPA: hypothetical protein PK274_08620, partial [Candidatus Fermentibacter daniensis]|nr:hypothetical protein [Candidatus Fermentibacter daniensis]HPN63240.1 hypothetical protein [Candidatus Fermentibacter daniensis]
CIFTTIKSQPSVFGKSDIACIILVLSIIVVQVAGLKQSTCNNGLFGVRLFVTTMLNRRGVFSGFTGQK